MLPAELDGRVLDLFECDREPFERIPPLELACDAENDSLVRNADLPPVKPGPRRRIEARQLVDRLCSPSAGLQAKARRKGSRLVGLALRPGFRLKARSPSIEPPGSWRRQEPRQTEFELQGQVAWFSADLNGRERGCVAGGTARTRVSSGYAPGTWPARAE